MKEKKGQVTIFIIIALLLIVFGVLIYFFGPKFGVGSGFSADNPQAFIQSCVEDDLQEIISEVSLQGGSMNPSPYFLYKDNKIQYLCYTNENYEFCKVQVPFLRDFIESQISKKIKEKVDSCFNTLGEKYKGKGYDFELKEGVLRTELLPRKILITLPGYEVTVSKEETKRYNSFNVIANTNLYQLVAIASNLVEWESTVGDSNTRVYMLVYPDELKIQKLKQTDDTKVYILENKKTGDLFQFAVRSLAFPPGI